VAVTPPRLPDPTRGSVLISTWLFGLLIATVVIAVVLWVGVEVRRVRRRRGGRPTWGRLAGLGARTGAAVLVILLVVTTVLDAVNRHYQYVPTFSALFGPVSRDLVEHPRSQIAAVRPAPPQTATGAAVVATSTAPLPPMPPHGVVEEQQVGGPASGVAPRRTFVYLPKEYFDPHDPTRRFPVLYLLHGSPGVSADWLRGAFVDQAMDYLIQTGALQPFIVVLPDVNGGYTRDTECQNVVGGPQTETYLATDVVDWTDSHYRTIGDRGSRAVGGLSTGGYCAFNLVLKHLDRFSAIVSHSGTFGPVESRYSGTLWGHDPALRSANTPRQYLPTLPIPGPLGVYADAGRGDGEAIGSARQAQQVFAKRNIEITFNQITGEGHSFAGWRKNLALSLPWVSRWFAGHPAPLGPDAAYGPVAPVTGLQ
jgi:enterochelin esterase-like enzyme